MSDYKQGGFTTRSLVANVSSQSQVRNIKIAFNNGGNKNIDVFRSSNEDGKSMGRKLNKQE